MPQLLVRNVSRDVVDALKKRALSRGRSAQAEHRAILENALSATNEAFWTNASRLRDETRGRVREESAVFIREDRDRR